jgi:hypothetical protein
VARTGKRSGSGVSKKSRNLGFWIWRTGKTVRGAVVQSAVTALWVYGCFDDSCGLALVFLRELCDGGLEV